MKIVLQILFLMIVLYVNAYMDGIKILILEIFIAMIKIIV